jgi:hypothetical protein
VIEGISPGQLGGVDQAHAEVPHVGPPLGCVKQGVLAIQDSVLQEPLADIIV